MAGPQAPPRLSQGCLQALRITPLAYPRTVEATVHADDDRAALVDRACRHYNDMQDWRAAEGRYTSDLGATTDSDPKFLERICVNYLRHCLTKYEDHLDAMSGKVGFNGCYEEVRRKVFAEIAAKYEWLAEECKRQQENW